LVQLVAQYVKLDFDFVRELLGQFGWSHEQKRCEYHFVKYSLGRFRKGKGR